MRAKMMGKEKLKWLKAAGWRAGSTEEFLKPSPAEAALVELRLLFSDTQRPNKDILPPKF